MNFPRKLIFFNWFSNTRPERVISITLSFVFVVLIGITLGLSPVKRAIEIEAELRELTFVLDTDDIYLEFRRGTVYLQRFDDKTDLSKGVSETKIPTVSKSCTRDTSERIVVGTNSSSNTQLDQPSHFSIRLSRGTRVRTSMLDNNIIRIKVLEYETASIPSIIFHSATDEVRRECLSPESWFQISRTTASIGGSLRFLVKGVQFGNANDSGNRISGLLIRGKYRILEKMLFVSGYSLVRSGDLFTGEQVRVKKNEDDETGLSMSLIFDFLRGDLKQSSFFVLGRTPSLDHGFIEVDRGKFSTKSIITSRWHDLAINHPILLGVTALLALFVAFAEIFGFVGAYWRGSKE